MWVESSTRHQTRKKAQAILASSGTLCEFASALLIFIASILLNIIDASYACLVLDLDNAQQTGKYSQPAMAQARSHGRRLAFAYTSGAAVSQVAPDFAHGMDQESLWRQ